MVMAVMDMDMVMVMASYYEEETPPRSFIERTL